MGAVDQGQYDKKSTQQQVVDNLKKKKPFPAQQHAGFACRLLEMVAWDFTASLVWCLASLTHARTDAHMCVFFVFAI